MQQSRIKLIVHFTDIQRNYVFCDVRGRLSEAPAVVQLRHRVESTPRLPRVSSRTVCFSRRRDVIAVESVAERSSSNGSSFRFFFFTNSPFIIVSSSPARAFTTSKEYLNSNLESRSAKYTAQHFGRRTEYRETEIFILDHNCLRVKYSTTSACAVQRIFKQSIR